MDGCAGEVRAGQARQGQLEKEKQDEDFFGNTHSVQQRRDIQFQKFFAPFSVWSFARKSQYYLYVWSSNPSQGDPAQVVGAGNLSYTFNRFITFDAGITSLPAVRSAEGECPYWLGVDAEWIHLDRCPVGYTAVPHPVGGHGNLFHVNIEMNF
jgi:hypothetical protein